MLKAKLFIHLLVVVIACFIRLKETNACTNILVTPGASEDGSAMLGYNTDDNELFGFLFHYPSSHEGTTPRKIYAWETGKYLGSIPEASETYNVIGNCNDQGLCIGETTFSGILELREQHPDSVIDYGSLIWLALQRCSTALEAIRTMTFLMDRYGYASTGESYSIVDAKEAWIMDVIGKGQKRFGAVWVAVRVPDGMVSAHSNRARITTFPRDDPDNCLFAEDVVDLARDMGLYDGTDADFNFSLIYDKKAASKVRYAEARIWDIFSALTQDDNFASKHLDCAMGLDPTCSMPLWIKPKKKVSLNVMRERMSSHYEGTSLYYGDEVGSGLFDAPYRPRPYSWNVGERVYVNERNIGVEKTGINFIAQIRGWMPPTLAALIWFAVDDASTAPRCPVYASSTRVSEAYRGLGTAQGKVRPIMHWNMKKAFWIQNMVSNFVYSRWRDSYPILKSKLDEVHKKFVSNVKEMDETALQLYHSDGPDAAIEQVTNFSVDAADGLHEEWIEFYGYMFVRFRDFVTIEEDPTNLACGCKTTEVGLTDAWRDRIVAETGWHYWVPEGVADGTGTGAGGDSSVPRRSHHSEIIFVPLVLILGSLLLAASTVFKRRKGKLERMLSLEEDQNYSSASSEEERTLL